MSPQPPAGKFRLKSHPAAPDPSQQESPRDADAVTQRKVSRTMLALAVLGDKAAAPTALVFCCDSIFLFSIVPFMIELTGREHPSLLHALGVPADVVEADYEIVDDSKKS